MLRLAVEWGKLEKVPPKVELLSGERRRDRVLTSDEERDYFRAAQMLGEDIENAYSRALEGIRAMRGQEPIKPGRPVPPPRSHRVADRLRTQTRRSLPSALGRTARRRSTRRIWEDRKRPPPRSSDGTSLGAARNAAIVRKLRTGILVSHCERPRREVHAQEATQARLPTRKGSAFHALHIPSQLPDALGSAHGPVHAHLPCRPATSV